MPNIVTHDHPEPEPLDDDPEVAAAIKTVIIVVGLAPPVSTVYALLGEWCPSLSRVKVGRVLRYFDQVER